MTHYESNEHMRTDIWVGGLSQAHDSGKANIFQANTKFFRQKTAAKNEKKNMFLFLLNDKKQNSFHPARRSAQNLVFLTNNYWMEWVRQKLFWMKLCYLQC